MFDFFKIKQSGKDKSTGSDKTLFVSVFILLMFGGISIIGFILGGRSGEIFLRLKIHLSDILSFVSLLIIFLVYRIRKGRKGE